VDESLNSSRALELFYRQGWLKFHSPRGPERRGMRPGRWTHLASSLRDAEGTPWVVDSWEAKGGENPVILPYSEWLKR
jgi:hypothetical protein